MEYERGEILDQPESPDPPSLEEEASHDDLTADSAANAMDFTETPAVTNPESLVDHHDDSMSQRNGEASKGASTATSVAAAVMEEPSAVEIQPDILKSLAGTELTPSMTALLKQMMDQKNKQEEEKAKKDAFVEQIKGLLVWDTLSEEVRAFFPDDYIHALAQWAMNSMQPEIIQRALLDQNKKELEYHKKRDHVVHEQQRETSIMKKRHAEALQDCDMKNTPHRKPIVAKANDEEMHKHTIKQEEELYIFDRKIVLAIDNLLTAQQKSFQQLGIPGMKETSASQDILKQMVVIDVLSRLAGIDGQTT